MLIEIEGPSGAGKTSLAKSLCDRSDHLARAVIDIASQEELRPHDLAWTLGSFMRGRDMPVEPLEATFLYGARTAARARLVTELCDEGILILDRFRFSLYVTARRAGLAPGTTGAFVDLATRGLVPDYTVLLDVDYETHCHRLTKRGHLPMAVPEFEPARTLFWDAYTSAPAPKLCLDTSALNAQEVQAAVLAHLPIPGGTPCGDMS